MPLSIDAALRRLREIGLPFSAEGGQWYVREVRLSSRELVLFADMLAKARQEDEGGQV